MNSLKRTLVLAALVGAISASLVVALFFSYFIKDSDFNFDEATTKQEQVPSEEVISSQDFLDMEKRIIQSVKDADPAVVSIIISKDVPVLERYYEDQLDPFFDDFFGRSPFSFKIPRYRENGTEKKEVGGGSGFIVSEDGYIVTNKHVVDEDNVEYTVFTNDGNEYKADVIAKDSLNDIAVIKIEASDLPFLNFANSDDLQVGQSVIAIGNPLLEFNNSVSVGIVSGLSREITARSTFGKSEHLEGIIQTDAAINPGNSGGPLLNLDGKVVGVNVAMASAENIGFALPSNLVENAVNSVLEKGKIVRPFLGIRYVPINKKLKESNKLSVDYGVLVIRGESIEDLAVVPGSSADKADIVENDIILEVDGKKIEKGVSLARIIAEKSIGDTVKLKILHKGEEKTVDVKLEEVPE